MYRDEKNRRNIFSIAAAIGLTIIFVGVGVRIFRTPKEEVLEDDNAFFSFAELGEHMAELKREESSEHKTKETGQEILEEKTEAPKQETSADKVSETGQQTSKIKVEETKTPTLENKAEAPKQTEQKTYTNNTNETEQEVSEEITEKIEPEVPKVPENEMSTVNQGSILDLEYTFTDAPEGYFNDALFIGDSRTVALEEYGNLEGADFFAVVGMSVYNLTKQTADAAGEKNISIETLLSNHSYGKIYFMLGLNELGYNRRKTVDRYRAWLEYIQQMQPQAIIFIEANLHVTAQKSASDEQSRNEDIDEFNNYTKELADNRNIFYVDVNEIFDDEGGSLRSDLTYDGVHILAKYYLDWCEWLRKKAVIR